MKVLFVVFLTIGCICKNIYGQPGLSIVDKSSFFIAANTVVSIDGLVMEPQTDFLIAGANKMQRNSNITKGNPLMQNILRSYVWETVLPPFSGSVGLYYRDQELDGLDENQLLLFTHNNVMWEVYSSEVVRETNNNLVTTSGISNGKIIELTLGQAFPLPLNWRPLQAERLGKDVLITWQAVSDEKMAFFEVERSDDGFLWSRVGDPVVPMNHSGTHKYKKFDYTASSKKTFYRIKWVNKDGTYHYSSIAFVNEVLSNQSPVIFPNPATRAINMLSPTTDPVVAISLRDATGRLLLQRSLPLLNQFSLPIIQLPPGCYYLEMLHKSGTTSQHTFLKNNH